MKEEQNIQTQEPSAFRLIATLGIAGFLSGVILVGIYLFTKPYIEANKARALEEAVFEVLPGTTYFESYEWDGKALIKAMDGSELIYFGYDSSDQFTGVAIPGQASGYQDVISALSGYDPEQGLIIGMKVLDSKETPGLGDKILLDDAFKNNFKALAVVPEIEVVKKGERTGNHQIEAITGATISSKAVGELLKEAIAKWKVRIEDHMNDAHGTD